MRKLLLLLLCVFILAGCAAPPPQGTAAASGGQPEKSMPAPSETAPPTQTPPAVASTATGLVQPVSAQAEASPTPDKRPLPEDWQEWPVVPEISENARQIYARGLQIGNDPAAFSKVGDCQNVHDFFLGIYEDPRNYRLGEEYAHLQETIDYYYPSFARTSLSVNGGWNVASVLSPMFSNKETCDKTETPLQCELNVNRPSVVIISMETWWVKETADAYEGYMRQIVEEVIEQGAVPVLATKADNLEGDHKINRTLAKLAYEYDIPLWNFWRAVQPLPNHGIRSTDPDGFHLSVGRNHYDDPDAMKNAWPVRNLTALQTLDKLRQELPAEGE